ncbi:MFS-type transporter involved in bile tolerance (Atg22 family) [Bacillus oleivorans]|uniref:MFS-type transporter involved in bile tolerance (Atg22 family) n=1 Tax=Bacillus oleivorans TaxID=1448271 RepID=A0A285D4K3_9BACI|nr:MFS transporter [Bacillus oleivorans]SNX74710.1 MFS-type transporter involved in bile tolerance (Atg22 family) [Bacillus oleivorans]
MDYTPQEICKNERLSIYNGAFQIIIVSFIGNFIPLFAIEVLDASNTQVGLISSLPSIMIILSMIPAAIWMDRFESKKKFTAINIFAARFLFLLLLFVPIIPMANQAWVLVVMIAVMNFPIAVSTLSWQSLIGDLIPDERRGQFFSKRGRILTIVGMFTTFASGLIINQFDSSDPYPFQVLFIIGFVFGLAEIYFLIKHIEYGAKPEKDQESMFKTIIKTFKHKPYFYFLVCACMFNFGWQMAWPLFTIYQINYAHATALWISIFTVINQIAQIVSYNWWGKMADKWGNSTMLFVCAIGMTTAPILTILTKNLYFLALSNLWTGLFVSGTVLLLFNQVLRVSPNQLRTSFLANYNLMIAFIGCIAPQLGVLLLDYLGMVKAMSISSVFRLLGGISFLLVVFYFENKRRNKKNHVNASV